MSARCSATAVWPYRWLISRVTKLVTPKPIAAGATSGPKPRIAPRAISLSSRAWTVPRATARRLDISSTPIRGSASSSASILASSPSSCASCSVKAILRSTDCAD
jgi:hypothetical protein